MWFKKTDLEKQVLLAAVFLDWEDVKSWNELANSMALSVVLKPSLSVQEKLALIGDYTIHRLERYPAYNVASAFETLNDVHQWSFRPKTWIKDHRKNDPGYLEINGCRNLEDAQALEAWEQVQDLSSQFTCQKLKIDANFKVWDVCSGAGGKSLALLSNHAGDFYLSDVRESILQNASLRLNKFRYSAQYGVVDLEQEQNQIKFDSETVNPSYFDAIVADVPCSGSGTWFRNPEHFSQFDYNELGNYSLRQKTIVTNSFKFLKSGGVFYYITCSIFNEENAQVKDWILENLDCTLNDELYFNGLKHGSDSMYMAAFTKT